MSDAIIDGDGEARTRDGEMRGGRDRYAELDACRECLSSWTPPCMFLAASAIFAPRNSARKSRAACVGEVGLEVASGLKDEVRTRRGSLG